VKIQGRHCERPAYVYMRQSTPWQVIEHRESTERQYHLREHALELGWPASRVEVIDGDQGRSGSTAAHRSGFQRLLTEVGMDRVGIVLMLEASRLARSNSDSSRSAVGRHTSRTHLYEGRWNKARKGLLQFPLPVGYVHGADGDRGLDPDVQVRERLAYLFAFFRRHGVVRSVVRELKREGLDLPTRVTSRDG
jgi:hypothetical protein